MTTEEAIAIAEQHANVNPKSIAAHVLRDAKAASDPVLVFKWCVESLVYSVGGSHPDYLRVRAAYRQI